MNTNMNNGISGVEFKESIKIITSLKELTLKVQQIILHINTFGQMMILSLLNCLLQGISLFHNAKL